MSDEFGQDPQIYVWPKDHEDGTAFPTDFWDRVSEGLNSVGIEWEPV
jgi:hypothetical protein